MCLKYNLVMTLTKKLYELQLVEDDIASNEQAIERITAQMADNSLLDKTRAEQEDGQKQ